MELEGRTWKFGDDVDTDLIIPARYLNTSDPLELASHLMEDADAAFSRKVGKGDLLVAGKNFGCGSSREHAPIAIKAADMSCVIAHSFARIFFRNALNIGLPIFESPLAAAGIREGDMVRVDAEKGLIVNLTREQSYPTTPLPAFMQELIAAGGLMSYVQKMMRRK